MLLNPLTYGVAALRRELYGETVLLGSDVPSLQISLQITVMFGILTALAALLWSGRPSARQLVQ